QVDIIGGPAIRVISDGQNTAEPRVFTPTHKVVNCREVSAGSRNLPRLEEFAVVIHGKAQRQLAPGQIDEGNSQMQIPIAHGYSVDIRGEVTAQWLLSTLGFRRRIETRLSETQNSGEADDDEGNKNVSGHGAAPHCGRK